MLHIRDLRASRCNRRASIFYSGIDSHVRSSTIGIVDRRGRKFSTSTTVTSAEGFAAGLGPLARRGLNAAAEESGITLWIWQPLKDLGVKVVVETSNRVRLIAESRKKTDRVDAETLAELLPLAPGTRAASRFERDSARTLFQAWGGWRELKAQKLFNIVTRGRAGVE